MRNLTYQRPSIDFYFVYHTWKMGIILTSFYRFLNKNHTYPLPYRFLFCETCMENWFSAIFDFVGKIKFMSLPQKKLFRELLRIEFILCFFVLKKVVDPNNGEL